MRRLIVLDTSILVDHLRGHSPASEAMQHRVTEGAQLAASVLTKVEILRGMRSAELLAVRRLFATLEWLAVSDDVAETAGQLARRYRTSHHSIEVPDYIIAATAHQLGAELWTRNVKHFPMFSGLAPPY